MNSARPEKDFDVIIIGAGPGGLSAAIWCADLGLKTAVIEEKTENGGQLLWTFNNISNYPGFTTIGARELRDRFIEQVKRTNVLILNGRAIRRVDLAKKTVDLDDGDLFSSRFIIIATGVRRRELGVQGESRLSGHGVLSSGVRDGDQTVGKDVIIVGGGDAALENALLLSAVARKVLIVHRGAEFSARDEFVRRAESTENISFRFSSSLIGITGDEQVTGVELRNLISNEISTVATQKILIRIGVIPNTELFVDQIDLDRNGYVNALPNCSTSASGIYAAGDVASPLAPTISSAAGMGATAAKCINREIAKIASTSNA